MLAIDEVRLTRDLAQELESLRVALAECARTHGAGDPTTSVLRRMIADRERALRAVRL